MGNCVYSHQNPKNIVETVGLLKHEKTKQRNKVSLNTKQREAKDVQAKKQMP